MKLSRILLLPVIAAVLQGCSTKYKILAGSSFPNPPQQRLKVLVLDFTDLTGQYAPLGRDFEDSLEAMLAPETVNTIINPAALKHQNAIWSRVKNPFSSVPRSQVLPALKRSSLLSESTIIEDITDAAPDKLRRFKNISGADIVIIGSVEEIYYGDKPAGLDTYLAFGLVGLAAEQGNKIARGSFRLQAVSLKDRKILFTKTVDGYSETSSDGPGRAKSLQEAVDQAAQVSTAYLLESKW